jgi:putative ABC transport system permease protein
MNAAIRFMKKLVLLFRRNRHSADLDEEMAFHREQAERELIASGMAPKAAHYAAIRQFGNATRIKEKSHETIGFRGEQVMRDCRYALRQFARSPGFSCAAILTLALGIGATTAIFTLVQATLLRRLPYPEADRIVNIRDVRLHGRSTGGLVGVPRFFDISARSNSFEQVAYFYFDEPTLIAGDRLPEPIEAAAVSGQFWKLFGVQPFLGRTFDERDTRPNMPQVVVLSYSAWQRIFSGDANVIGQAVTLDKETATIVGIMPRSFQIPGATELWLPSTFTAAGFQNRGDGTRFVNVFGRVKTGISLPAAETDVHRIGEQLRQEYPGTDAEWQFGSEPMRDHLFGEIKPALIVLLIASGMLLLIACINVANLLLSRATVRQREVALRRALGASQARIVVQFLTESTLLALGGGGIGLGMAFTLVHAVATKLPGRLGLPGAVTMDWPVVWFAFAVSVATGIAFGLVPAWRSRHLELSPTLKRGESRLAGSPGGDVRNVLVAVQVAISLVLLVGASLLTESLWKLMKSPLGFEPEHVLTFDIKLPWEASPAGVDEFYANVQRRIESLPGVSAVGQIDALPTADWHLRSNFDADWLPRIANHPAINAEDRHIAGDFLRAIGASLVAGRTLTAEDARAKVTPILVNQQFALQYRPIGSVIGRHLLIGSEPFEIVGVLANVRGTAGSIGQSPGAEVYFPADGDQGVVGRSLVVRSQLPLEQLTRAIQEQVHQVDPQQAIRNVSTMDERIATSTAQPRMNMALLGSFAAIALLLACVGIYGVVAFSVAQRRQEVGIRMALGATRAQISLLFVRRAMTFALVGVAAGSAGALIGTHLIKSQLYEVQPNDPVIYIAAIMLLMIPVVAATLRAAHSAANVNPVEALRAE